MHGLIFKTKESHRQDQSESFVINTHLQNVSMCVSFSFHNKSNEITSSWPVLVFTVNARTQCSVDVFIRCFIETKQNQPTYIDAFLFLMQLVYKHSSPNFQHMTSCRNRSTRNCFVCVSWNIFNRIHVFAICDVYFLRFSFMCKRMYILGHFQSWRSSFDKLLSTTHDVSYVVCTYLLLHIANCINTAAAEQSLHHNIILEKQDHPSVSRTGTDNRKRGSGRTRTPANGLSCMSLMVNVDRTQQYICVRIYILAFCFYPIVVSFRSVDMHIISLQRTTIYLLVLCALFNSFRSASIYSLSSFLSVLLKCI